MRKYIDLRPNIALGLIFAFLVNSLGPISTAKAEPIFGVEGEFHLPAPGILVHLSPEFNPPILKGIKVHPDNPFRFDFILDQGDSVIASEGPHTGHSQVALKQSLKEQSIKLIKYFLASLTIPEKDLWVNLSPYEKDRIIPNSFGLTEMGRDLLAEDYMLKQITASLIYPEDAIGKKFWKRIYEEAAKKFGTTNIPVNTFNKVWIVPEKAVVYENAKAGTAYVVESKLKVMLEQDYLSLSHHVIPVSINVIPAKAGIHDTSTLGFQIVREIVIPELTKEVNQDKNFAQLRQVYNSLILATWYKKKIKDSILSQVYANKNKVSGILSSPNALVGDPEQIYQRYLQAFKKGAYNYIKEDQDPLTQQTVPRKYFSGGANLALEPTKALIVESDQGTLPAFINSAMTVQARIDPAMVHYDETELAKDRRSPIDIFLDNPTFKEKYAMQRSSLKLDEVTYGHYFQVHSVGSRSMEFYREGHRGIFADMVSFSENAYTDSPVALEARKFLWKMGEIFADAYFRNEYEKRATKMPLQDFIPSGIGLGHLPILDVASGVRSALFMAKFRDQRLILTDNSYYVEGYLNRMKKHLGLGDNIVIRRIDVRNVEALFANEQYKFIRLGNVDAYIEGYPMNFVPIMLERIAPGGMVIYEYRKNIDQPFYPSLEKIRLEVSKSRWWEVSNGSAPSIMGQDIAYYLFKKMKTASIEDVILQELTAGDVELRVESKQGRIDFHLLRKEGKSVKQQMISNPLNVLFDANALANILPVGKVVTVSFKQSMGKQEVMDELSRSIFRFDVLPVSVAINAQIGQIDAARPVDLRIELRGDAQIPDIVLVWKDENEKTRIFRLEDKDRKAFIDLIPEEGRKQSLGKVINIHLDPQHRTLENIHGELLIALGQLTNQAVFFARATLPARETSKKEPKYSVTVLNSLPEAEFLKVRRQIDAIALYNEAKGAMFTIPESTWNDVRTKDKTTQLSTVIQDPTGKVLGFALVLPVDANSANIDKIAVHPSSVREGLGTVLLNAVASQAIKAGVPILTLAVLKTNTVAQAVYSELGFKNLTPPESRGNSEYNAFGFGVTSTVLLENTKRKMGDAAMNAIVPGPLSRAGQELIQKIDNLDTSENNGRRISDLLWDMFGKIYISGPDSNFSESDFIFVVNRLNAVWTQRNFDRWYGPLNFWLAYLSNRQGAYVLNARALYKNSTYLTALIKSNIDTYWPVSLYLVDMMATHLVESYTRHPAEDIGHGREDALVDLDILLDHLFILLEHNLTLDHVDSSVESVIASGLNLYFYPYPEFEKTFGSFSHDRDERIKGALLYIQRKYLDELLAWFKNRSDNRKLFNLIERIRLRSASSTETGAALNPSRNNWDEFGFKAPWLAVKNDNHGGQIAGLLNGPIRRDGMFSDFRARMREGIHLNADGWNNWPFLAFMRSDFFSQDLLNDNKKRQEYYLHGLDLMRKEMVKPDSYLSDEAIARPLLVAARKDDSSLFRGLGGFKFNGRLYQVGQEQKQRAEIKYTVMNRETGQGITFTKSQLDNIRLGIYEGVSKEEIIRLFYPNIIRAQDVGADAAMNVIEPSVEYGIAVEIAFNKIDSKPKATVFGVGDGKFMMKLREIHPRWAIIGYDLLPRFPEHLEGYVHRDARRTGIRSNSVDVVTINMPFLDEFEKDSQGESIVSGFLKEAKRILKPNGKVYLVTDFQNFRRDILRQLKSLGFFIEIDGQEFFDGIEPGYPRSTYMEEGNPMSFFKASKNERRVKLLGLISDDGILDTQIMAERLNKDSKEGPIAPILVSEMIRNSPELQAALESQQLSKLRELIFTNNYITRRSLAAALSVGELRVSKFFEEHPELSVQFKENRRQFINTLIVKEGLLNIKEISKRMGGLTPEENDYIKSFPQFIGKKRPAYSVGKKRRAYLENGSNFNKAMTAGNTDLGGIDLTSDKALSVQNNGEGIKFHIDPAQLQQLQNASGFTPVIIDIQPMTNLRMFLGLAETNQSDFKASITS